MKNCNSAPAPSFRAHLLHKLRIITEAEGSRKAVADLLGVHKITQRHWYAGAKWPHKTTMAQIDRLYLIAWEKLRIYGAKRHPSSGPFSVGLDVS